MTLFIDVENKKLVQSLTSDRSVPAPIFMQGDNEPLEIFLLQKGEESLYEIKPLVVGTDFLRVAIARFKGYPKSLTYAAGYALNPNGAAEVLLPLNTKDIEIALQEQEYISAFLEVEYSNTEGKVITVLQTACRVKNDLIDNAPTVELQEQFYDKVYTDTVFSKKSANLSDLADKSASRTNLGVYSKSETDAKDALALEKASNLSDLANKETARSNLSVYSKSEVDSKHELDLKKAENLSDLADTEQARANLDVPQVCELAPLGSSGIISPSSLTISGSYGYGIGDDFPQGEKKWTFLTTYLSRDKGGTLFSSAYTDYNYFYPAISADGSKLDAGYIYSYDSETGTDNSREVLFPISNPIKYGDKIAMTLDDRDFKLYKGLELVASGTIPDELYIYSASSFLSWKGLKKDIVYSCSMILPLTSAEGTSSKLNYSIEDYMNGEYPPKTILSSRFYDVKTTFLSTFSYSNSGIQCVGGASIGNKSNCLKISLKVLTYSYSREYNLPVNSFSASGIKYRIKFNVYFPTTNPNVTKLQLKLGSYALSTAGTIISKNDNIDNSGYIQPKDEWQEVDVTLRMKYTGTPKLCLLKGSSSYYKIEEETTDAVYVRDIYAWGIEGIEGLFYGSTECDFWINKGASKYNLTHYNGYSLPCDGSKTYLHKIKISAFNNSYYEYFDSSIAGLALSQIILKFDGNVADTSQEEDDNNKNIFVMNLNGYEICREQIPALNAGMAYNIYPHKGINNYFSSIDVMPMYSCSCGGTIDLIFTKTD